MKVFLTKDVVKLGLAGEIVNVKDGYAKNFLLPNKLGQEVTKANEKFFAKKQKQVDRRKEIIESNTSMLAEKIGTTSITIKRKLHDDGKLYGSISQHEVVDALQDKGISVSKSQVHFDKAIKEKGAFEVTIKLSSRLQPHVQVKVVGE